MEFKDYYKILEVDPSADSKTIKTAYRKLARKYHPDVSEHHESENKFKEVAEAYEVLRDKEKRAEYDEIRQYGRHGQQFDPPPEWSSTGSFQQGFSQHKGDFSDFFSSIFGMGGGAGSGFESGPDASMFGNRPPYNPRGQDIETELPVFLEETLSKESKKITYRLPHSYPDGRVTEITKTLDVKIPAGVRDGERIRLKGQGSPGVGSGPCGDLYLRIRLVPHPLFDVEGHHLIITVPLAPWEAALGCQISLPTLTGTIHLTIPENSQAGQRLRIKGKGLVRKSGYGDLFAVLKVVMPPDVTGDTKSHWQQLANKATFNPRAEWGHD